MRDFFEQVWLINLARRPERLDRFLSELEAIGWPFAPPRIFSAIDGNKVGVPRYWKTGGGSYGCMRSHLSILERAIQDDVGSFLVLEDDATFMPDFANRVTRFLRAAPKDWQCLMIGGQHVNSTPQRVSSGVVRAGNGGGIQRTHCYALRGMEPMRELYHTWANAAVHCDWVMGPCMAKYRTYAPDPFLAGQASGSSDITAGVNPAKLWRVPTGQEPVILLRAPRPAMEELRDWGWHGGYYRDEATGIDMGLRDIFGKNESTDQQRREELSKWIEMIQCEVMATVEPGVCVIWHPKATAALVRPLVRGALIEIHAKTAQEAQAAFKRRLPQWGSTGRLTRH